MSGDELVSGDPPDEWVRRYLRLLELQADAPSLQALSQLARNHLIKVPFSNIGALMRWDDSGRRPPPLDLSALLHSWESCHGTGVCFEVATALLHLLTRLGYDVRRISATTGGFVGSHRALLVSLGLTEYLVDVGNGAPLFEPIPLGRTTEIRHAGLAYRFRPGEVPNSHFQERWVNETWSLFCTYDVSAQSDENFDEAYCKHFTPGQSYVLSELRLVTFNGRDVRSLRGSELTIYSDQGKSVSKVSDLGDYHRALEETFRLPALPLASARRIIAEAKSR